MKIQCNACEVAEAKVLCCADEAALCLSCDEKVHDANKLASKHQRVSLSTSSAPMPKCDICQETVGYFFCLEDRALLCRKCDIAIHKANAYVSAHQRFLLTGVKVGLEPTDPSASPSSGKSQSIQKVNDPKPIQKVKDPKPPSLSKRTAPVSVDAQYNKVLPAQKSGVGDCGLKSLTAGGSGSGSSPHWQLDDFLGHDFNLDHGCMDDGSSKVDNGKLGELDCSPFLRGLEGVDIEECFGQVPETSWAVPQITSPPTASGLYWPNNYQSPYDSAMFASDISYSPWQNLQVQQSDCTGFVKKRRQC